MNSTIRAFYCRLLDQAPYTWSLVRNGSDPVIMYRNREYGRSIDNGIEAALMFDFLHDHNIEVLRVSDHIP